MFLACRAEAAPIPKGTQTHPNAPQFAPKNTALLHRTSCIIKEIAASYPQKEGGGGYKDQTHVHPDRNHAQPRDPEISSGARRDGRRHGGFPRCAGGHALAS